ICIDMSRHMANTGNSRKTVSVRPSLPSIISIGPKMGKPLDVGLWSFGLSGLQPVSSAKVSPVQRLNKEGLSMRLIGKMVEERINVF
ncbi:MAG: hypothetical protein ACKOJE_03180, partial [Bacteroidota bacterium]